MRKFLKNFKKWKSLLLSSLISLIFVKEVKALDVHLPAVLYGPIPPTPTEALWRFLPWIGGMFLFFVLAPVLGLRWYRKQGGRKKWPAIITWILVSIFLLALTALIFLILALTIYHHF